MVSEISQNILTDSLLWFAPLPRRQGLFCAEFCSPCVLMGPHSESEW